jgi:iron complex outermembrane receptor protein
VLYYLQPSVQLFANASKSYEPPSFGELTGGATPVLNAAQKAWTYEVGTRGVASGVTWDLALYHADVRDELLTADPGGTPNTVNIPHTVHQGIELGTSGAIVKNLEWRQQLLYNRFRFDDDPVFGNNTLPGIPKTFFTGEIVYRAPFGLYGGPNLTWSPQKYPIDMANTFYADDYFIWGLRVGQQIGKHWSWFVEGRNLSDKRYASATGVIRNANGLDTAQFLPGDGRAFYAGLQWQL